MAHPNTVRFVFLTLVLSAVPGGALDPVPPIPGHDTVSGAGTTPLPGNPTDGPSLGQETKLTAPDPVPDSYVGRSVAVDGDVMAAGSSEELPSGSVGVVHVWERTDSSWRLQERLLPPNQEEGKACTFGDTLALEDEFLLVGDPCRDANGWMAGTVYLYERDQGTWFLKQEFEGEGGGSFMGLGLALSSRGAWIGSLDHSDGNHPVTDFYLFEDGNLTAAGSVDEGKTGSGQATSLSGSTGIVGNSNGESSSGKATIYEATSDGWTEVAVLEDPTPHARDSFGWSTDIHDDRAIVGEFFGDQAHIYQKSDDGWNLETTIRPPSGASDSFGHPVAIEEDLALVGAPHEEMIGWQAPSSEGIGEGAGAIYVYRLVSTVTGDEAWEYKGRVTARDAGSGDGFGYRMDLHGETVAIGAFTDDVGRNTTPARFLGLDSELGEGDHGSVYIFSPDDDGDNVANRSENWSGTDSGNADTDRDGIDDGTEVRCGWDPTDASSPHPPGAYTSDYNSVFVPVGEHRWWICGLQKN